MHHCTGPESTATLWPAMFAAIVTLTCAQAPSPDRAALGAVLLITSSALLGWRANGWANLPLICS